MSSHSKQACVFGGTGFIGRYIVSHLAKRGYRVIVPCRLPEKGYFLKTQGNVGQIVPVSCNLHEPSDLARVVKGCDVVVNGIGILAEKGQNSFQRVHIDLAARIASVCAFHGVRSLIHLSALGCERATSLYALSKKAGEEAVLSVFPRAVILRPGVVFGAEDRFFNFFARCATILPFLPLIGGGTTRLQPVFVGDVAEAVTTVMLYPQACGHIFELGGPESMTFRQVYDRLFSVIGIRRPLVSIPWGLARLQGKILGLFPNPILTDDQVQTLKSDCVTTGRHPTFADLGIIPTGMDAILPSYLSRFQPSGRFGDKITA